LWKEKFMKHFDENGNFVSNPHTHTTTDENIKIKYVFMKEEEEKEKGIEEWGIALSLKQNQLKIVLGSKQFWFLWKTLAGF